MKLIQVGRRRINLEYLIMDEENDGTEETAHIPAGGVRVTMEAGKEFNLVGEDAETYRRHACDQVMNDPEDHSDDPGSATIGYPVDPSTGERRKGNACG